MNILKTLLDLILGKGLTGHRRVSTETSTEIKNQWERQVEPALKSRKPSQLRQALITADKLLDAALKDLSKGENMGQRLKNSKDLFEWNFYDKLWKAHKVRNSLVHDLSYEPTYFVLEEKISVFKEGLQELGVNL
jgi:hypothetical protein